MHQHSSSASGRLLVAVCARAATACLLAAGLAPAAACSGGNEADSGSAPDVDRVGCDTVLDGIPLGDDAPERAPGYDDELAALDLSSAGDTLDLSPLSIPHHGLVAYALETPRDALGSALSTDEALAKGPLGKAVVAGFVRGAESGEEDGFDLEFFRRGLHRFYSCDRGFPVDLDNFKALYGDFRDLEFADVNESVPKRGETRRLYEDHDQGVYIAETLTDDGVRETEVLLSDNRTDGNIDFAVYGTDGKLTDRSHFAQLTGDVQVLATPVACMGCHVNYETQAYDVVFPVLP